MLRAEYLAHRPLAWRPVAIGLPALLLALTFTLCAFAGDPFPRGSMARRSELPIPFPAGLASSVSGPGGRSPGQIRHAYGIDQLAVDGAGQVIAVVTAYESPSIASDLQVFNEHFGLPPMLGLSPQTPCTVAQGPHPCFERVRSNGPPSYQDDWAIETALNVQWAHAIAPGADILLVEAPVASFDELLRASDVAVARQAHIVALSWGSAEFPEERQIDQHFRKPQVVFVAPAGDSGSGVLYPAASPYVVAIGGTNLTLDPHGEVASETAWTGSGGGESSYEDAPPYQIRAEVSAPHRRRVIPDVSAAADPHPGFAVYNSRSTYGRGGWFRQGGTSAGVPQWAALFALANQSRNGDFLSSTNLDVQPLYQVSGQSGASGAFRDIFAGTNGDCPHCEAGAGFDWVTGFGSPRAEQLVPALAGLHQG